jgi:hypothetical protein
MRAKVLSASDVDGESPRSAEVPGLAALARNKCPITSFHRWDEKAGLRGIDTLPVVRRAQGTKKRRPAMQKLSTRRVMGRKILKGH